MNNYNSIRLSVILNKLHMEVKYFFGDFQRILYSVFASKWRLNAAINEI